MKTARDVMTDTLLQMPWSGRNCRFTADQQIKDLTLAGYSIVPTPTAEGWTLTPPGGVHAELLRALNTAEEGAGTMPARQAVKLRPADWHALATAIRALASRTEREAKT